MKVQISLAAVPIKTYFKYLKRKKFPLRFENSPITRLYADMFKQCAIENGVYNGKPVYRLYYPLKNTDFSIQPDPEVVDYLESAGFLIEDYTKGLVVKKGDKKKQLRKIGKVLSKDKNILLKYNNQKAKHGMKEKAEEQYSVVVSRHPYDFLGMSTDREWSSCTRLGIRSKTYPEKDQEDPYRLRQAQNYDYLLDDVQIGSLVVYLIKHDDLNISKPLARMRILRYVNKNTDDYVLRAHPSVYGRDIKGFRETVESWVDAVSPVQTDGLYCVLDAADTRRGKVIGDRSASGIAAIIADPIEFLEYDDKDEEPIVGIDDLRRTVEEFIENNPDKHEEILEGFLGQETPDEFAGSLISLFNTYINQNIAPKFLVNFINEYARKGTVFCEVLSDDLDTLTYIIDKIPLTDYVRSVLYPVIDDGFRQFGFYNMDGSIDLLHSTKIKQNKLKNNMKHFKSREFLDYMESGRFEEGILLKELWKEAKRHPEYVEDVEDLYRMARSTHRDIKQELLELPFITREVINILMDDQDQAVRAAIVRSGHADADQINILSYDDSASVRRAVVFSDSLTQDQIERLSKDSDLIVREKAKKLNGEDQWEKIDESPN